MSKFEWEPGDLILEGTVDPNREILEDAHGRLFPDADTVTIPTEILAREIVDAKGLGPDEDVIAQALALVRT